MAICHFRRQCRTQLIRLFEGSNHRIKSPRKGPEKTTSVVHCVQRQRVPKKDAVRNAKGRGDKQATHRTTIIENPIPLAMYPAYPSACYFAGIGSEEMIPPLCGLNSLVFSARDTIISEADSILGKRIAEYQEGDVDSHRALVLRDDIQHVGKLKKGRSGPRFEESLDSLEDLEATSHGAAGQLTGSHDATRQAQ
jgi:hypothetical protein